MKTIMINGLNFFMGGRKKLIDEGKRFIREESGIGVVEMILILVVLIGLVVIFRDQLTTIIGTIFERIASDSAAI